MDHDQSVRYARTMALPEIGEQGQEKLLKSKVLVVGAGGLGSPLLLYLAASGVGTIGVIDHDRVSLSNLARQIMYETGDIGQPKVLSSVDALYDLNPDIKIIPYHEKLTKDNAESIIKEYDIVADGCDNFQTRFLVNEFCFALSKPLVSAAVNGFSGHLYTFKSYLGDEHPCYQCFYPALPSPDATPKCSESGVLGPLVGQMGSWQAIEVIKELLEIGTSLSGSVMIVDALSASVKKVKIPVNPDCECCGGNKT